MPSTLFIRLLTPAEPLLGQRSEDAAEPLAEDLAAGFRLHCEWLFDDGAGHREQGWADYEGLQALAAGEGGVLDPSGEAPLVVAFASNTCVLCLQCQVPGRRPGQMRQALPFVVEEFVAEDIDNLHISPGPVQSGAPVRCCLIAKPALENWLACLASVGLAPQWLLAESELLPTAADRASVLFDGEAALVRCGGQAAPVERANLAMALAVLQVRAVHCINGTLADLERSQLAADIDVATEAALENGAAKGVIGYLAERWPDRAAAINLLQGPYKPGQRATAQTSAWRRIGTLAALWLLVGLLVLTAKGWWSATQADALEAQSLALYRDIFPADRSVTVQSLRRRLSAKLGADAPGGASRSLVDLVGHLAAVVKPNMTVASIDYHRGRGEFNVDLLVEHYGEVEALREALAAQAGLQTEIVSAEEVDEGVRARFRLRGV